MNLCKSICKKYIYIYIYIYMNFIQSSGSLQRDETNPQHIDYDRFYDKFDVIGDELDNDNRFAFKKKDSGYIIEYKSDGNDLDNGNNNGSDCHLTLHNDVGTNHRFHIRDNNTNRNIELKFYIDKIIERYSYNISFKLVIKKKNQNNRLHQIEIELLDRIQEIFSDNYQQFLEEEDTYSRIGYGGNRGENTKYTNIKDETYKQKYLKYKKKYLDLKKIKFGGNNMNQTSL